MGRAGPPPSPTALRVLKGDRPYRINKDEPQPPDTPIVRPAWLSPHAREEWDRVVPDLKTMGTIKAVDVTPFAAYCESVSRFRAAAAIVERSGPLLVTKDGDVKRNPAVAQMRDAATEMRNWATHFGLTPSARQPLRVQHSTAEGSGQSLQQIFGS